ncbi:hypothetical protein [Streptomyces sp. NBC_01602]|uniref:hypothetical protein n=1 Tax=Streptomyces sp. NBC_01602 TaxID=2975893 RepID=UPI003867C9EF|nr:hypothetical protein OG955_00280 [Streptomyces sp. NBC_01602]
MSPKRDDRAAPPPADEQEGAGEDAGDVAFGETGGLEAAGAIGPIGAEFQQGAQLMGMLT